jgi:hypothetical protein
LPTAPSVAISRTLAILKSFTAARMNFLCCSRPSASNSFAKGGAFLRAGILTQATGLSKSSVTDALNEAIEKGIILRKKRSGYQGNGLTSRYAVNWEKVFDLVAKLKKRRSPKRA